MDNFGKNRKFQKRNFSKQSKLNEKQQIICRCNNVNLQTIEDSIRTGCQTMNEIFDKTSAGVGACGGTCRKTIVPILQWYLEHRDFPPNKKGEPKDG